MGNTHVKPHPRLRNKKQVHWKAAGDMTLCFGKKQPSRPSPIEARPPVPGKPQLVPESSGTPDLVTITWTKPNTDGGSPITGYLVEHRRTGSPHWVRATPILVPLTELTISGLEPGWRYQFRVSAENAVGISDPSELSEPITVTLQRSAITAPRFTQELQETTALENEKTEFAVHFLGQPPPKVCWYKDAYEIFSSRRIRILTESDRSILTIHQCSLSDEGEIKCTATNRAGHVTTKAKLTIQAPPSIRLPRQYEDGLLFEIGEFIRLKVSVAGRPTPLVFWTHDGDSIKNDDRYEIEYVDKSSVLKVNEAIREDRGEYQIKAVNKLGEDVQSFLVTVTDKPSPPGRARVVMALGRSVTLSWSQPYDDGGCKIGNYIVEYYRLGWNVWLKAATSRQLTTILGDLIEGSEYKFRIKAESPYGVSDPSEESDVIFIPDPKRGILQPPARSRSQPRDVKQEPGTPAVTRRKKRSQSSHRVEKEKKNDINLINSIEKSAGPKPPERKKIKSPALTPEASPIIKRKNNEMNINKEMFDRTYGARDLAYGSPEIKVKKELLPQNNLSSGSDKSRTPSPLMIANKPEDHKVFTVKIEPPPKSPSPKSPPRSPSPVKTLTVSPNIQTRKLSRDNFTGSSEFMLVLYPGENEKGQYDLDSDDDTIPPPMSLSAPELGAEMPQFSKIRTSVSSTELLHERAMMRLYAAAEAEEHEVELRKKSGDKGAHTEIPKIQINSKEEENVLQNQLLQRRLSSSGVAQQQLKLLQKRHSLKSPSEIKHDIIQSKQNQIKQTIEEKREHFASRQRSESEEKEEEIFEGIRKKGTDRNKPNTEKRKINIVDLDKWADDYESSTESDESDESYVDVRKEITNTHQSRYSDEEIEETYHPGPIRNLPLTNPILVTDKDPFEILSVKKEPPTADFVPKPILKRHELEEPISKEAIPLPAPPQPKRPNSPMPPNIIQRDRSQSLIDSTQILLIHSPPKSRSNSPNTIQRDRSQSLVEATFTNQSLLLPIPPQFGNRSISPVPQKERSQSIIEDPQTLPANLKTLFELAQPPLKQKQRSFSLMPQKELLSRKLNSEKSKTVDTSKPASTLHTITEGAKISGITAASVVIPDKLLEQQKAAEESKVAADHYGEIVRNYSKPLSNPHIDRRVSQSTLPANDEVKISQNIFTKKQMEANVNQKQFETKKENEPSPRRSSFMDQYNQPVKTGLINYQNRSQDPGYSEHSPLRSSFTDHYDTSPRRDSVMSPSKDSMPPPRRESMIDNVSPRKDSLTHNRSQDPGYSDHSPLRSSFTDHYDPSPRRDSLVSPRKDNIPPPRRESMIDNVSPRKDSLTYNRSQDPGYSDHSPLRSSFTDHYDTSSRKDSMISPKKDITSPRRESTTDNVSPRKDSVTYNLSTHTDNLTSNLTPKRNSLTINEFPKRESIVTDFSSKDNLISSGRKDSLVKTKERNEKLHNLEPEFSKVDEPQDTNTMIMSTHNQNQSSLTNVIIPYGGNIQYNVSEKRSSLTKDQDEYQIVKREPNIIQSMSPARSSSRSRTSSTSSSVKTETWDPKSDSKVRTSRRRTSPSPMGSEKRSKTLPSPMRQHKPRKTSPSPLRQVNKRQVSPSPHRYSDYRPMLREIMTQTSGEIVVRDEEYLRNLSTEGKTHHQEELFAQTEVRVRSFVDYLTDLAMFIVACWFYLFSNELYAIPFMLIMVYRQLQTEIAKRIPKWLLRRLKKKSK